ncbi:hypothetical protein A0U90_13330 (plasmid) [Kozakia baliensis]|nr:hypothetical protein A0U90_13330 [Kozakia baliensis]
MAGNTLYYMLLVSAVHNVGIAMTSLVSGFVPVAVTVIGSRDKGAVSLRRLLPSLLLCAGGAICIGAQAAGRSAGAGDSVTGVFCAIEALFSWTFYAVGNRRAVVRLHHVTPHDWNLLTEVITGAQALALLPLSARFESVRHRTHAWLAFGTMSLGVAVLASIVGNALWNRMSRFPSPDDGRADDPV